MSKLKKSDLKAHLLHSVQLLKRSLDYSDYTYFILAMLFFQYAKLSNQSTTFSRAPQVVSVPSMLARTSGQRKQKTRQDEIADSFSALEDVHPPLTDVLLPALPENPLDDSLLSEYGQLLERFQQTTGVFSNSDSFSHAYEYWIDQLAMMTVRRDVAFYTRRSLVRLMVEIVKPKVGMSIYDPTVGTGGMLIESARYVRQHGGNPESLRFTGREKSPDIWAICKMNLLVHGIQDATIERGDTLQNSPNATGVFDLVLQNFPLSANTRSGQLADSKFLRHALQSLSYAGKAAILAPSTILQHDHQELWHDVLSRDWLEAVISLPPRLLHGTPAGACLLIFNKQKSLERLSHVLFIKAAPQFVPSSRHDHLQDSDIQTAVQAVDRWSGDLENIRVIPVQQIEAQNYTLNVDRYLERVETPQALDVGAALSRYQTAVKKREAAVEKLMKTLESLNYPPAASKDGKSGG
ncbi:MAG: N-6 DNA methylase [Chloroflexota bacterium]